MAMNLGTEAPRFPQLGIAVNNYLILCRDVELKVSSRDTISGTQLISNSLIRKLSLSLQHNSTKELFDTNPSCERAFTLDALYLAEWFQNFGKTCVKYANIQIVVLV